MASKDARTKKKTRTGRPKDSPREREMSPIESLSDDCLRAVLALLRTDDLLRCRRVCRRWAAAALDEQLWTRRALAPYRYHDECGWEVYAPHEDKAIAFDSPSPEQQGLLKAALVRAPRAARLELDGLERLGPLLGSTRCAAERLVVCVRSDADGPRAATAIQRQVTLKRLRSLSVRVSTDSQSGFLSGAAAGSLLAKICRAEKLEELDIDLVPPLCEGRWASSLTGKGSAVPKEGKEPPASLKIFSYRSVHLGPPIHLGFLLRTHAATLTEVNLCGMNWPSAVPPAGLFNAMPNLRRLDTPLLQDMRKLECPALRELGLRQGFQGSSGYSDATAPALLAMSNVQAFMRSPAAASLTALALRGWEKFPGPLSNLLGSNNTAFQSLAAGSVGVVGQRGQPAVADAGRPLPAAPRHQRRAARQAGLAARDPLRAREGPRLGRPRNTPRRGALHPLGGAGGAEPPLAPSRRGQGSEATGYHGTIAGEHVLAPLHSRRSVPQGAEAQPAASLRHRQQHPVHPTGLV